MKGTRLFITLNTSLLTLEIIVFSSYWR